MMSSAASSASSVQSGRSGGMEANPTHGHGHTYSHDHNRAQPDLDTLVSHLAAAKRSLSSIHHVWRANEIVTAARAALEESVIVSARTGFLRRGLDEQIRLLYKVRTEVENVAHRGRAEFAAAIKELDTVDSKLQQTLDSLRQTTLERGFRSLEQQQEEAEKGVSKTLHDFIDEHAVDDIQSLLKDAIDNVSAAQSELDVSNRAFDNDLQSIQQALDKYKLSIKRGSVSSLSLSASSSASRVKMPTPTVIPELLHSLELNAQEMADLLESLVRHFDLCVTAVKHTEGGGVLARNITGDLPTDVGIGIRAGGNPQLNTDDSNNNNNSYNDDAGNPNPQLEPLTDSDYRDMIAVIAKDAGEAEDVVLEIQDRITEMESTLERVLEQRDSLITASVFTTAVFRRLDEFESTRLPEYVAQSHKFEQTWNTEHERMESGMADLNDLRGLYMGFLDAYDGLILEVARRMSAKKAAEDILKDARARLDALYEEDVRAREAFRIDQGDYLPSDIWPGLSMPPSRVVFRRIRADDDAAQEDKDETTPDVKPDDVEQQQQQDPEGDVRSSTKQSRDGKEDFGESIPNLPKHVIEQAFARLNSRGTSLPS
ncbi:Atg17p [Nannizzia gypsea CBS 118893]|uniref:Autophagy-related protein 17 n=1 Tax=Arthroderma gypseum (strain ATCC MYA-4604 / CBS 118893) TaxID=535722 RepID=E4URG3_ARTGP|nr:Atg17p [Nannizzia gypsea CBS 118893]EFQ99385.1 Atg17p [Nannizzia gypsea CBS 118893]